MATIENRITSMRLVGQAMSIQLSEDGSLAEVEALLRQALDLWADNPEALEEAAHFYDAVLNDQVNAVKYAGLCRARALAIAASMDAILSGRTGLT